MMKRSRNMFQKDKEKNHDTNKKGKQVNIKEERKLFYICMRTIKIRKGKENNERKE